MEFSYKIDRMDDSEVLITGGLGFIGSNLAHKLVEYGANVTVLDAMIKPYGGNEANVREIKDKINVVIGDVRDEIVLAELVKNKTCIFHLAAQIGRELSMRDPFEDIDINCRGTMNLLKCCRRYNDNAKLVYTGTRAQVGEPVYLPVDEAHPTNPNDIYGINKLAAEKYVLSYNCIYGIPATSLRLSNVYGPRSQMRYGYYGIVNWFIALALTNRIMPVYGQGKQTRDYVYVEDVVDALCLTMRNKRSNGQVFMVGSGQETKFMEMVKEVIRAVGKGSYRHVPFPPQLKKIDVRRFVVNYNKIKNYLGWFPRTKLGEGLDKTVRFYRDNLQYYV